MHCKEEHECGRSKGPVWMVTRFQEVDTERCRVKKSKGQKGDGERDAERQMQKALRAGSTTSAGGSMITKLPERRRPLILVDFVPSFCGRFQPLGISAFHWMTNLLLRQHWQRALACGNCSKSLRDPSGGYRRLLDLGCLGRWAV